MKHFHRFICIIAVLALLLLSACGKSDASAATAQPAAPAAAPADTPVPSPAPAVTEAPKPDPTPEPTPEPTQAPAYDTAAYDAALEALLDEYRLVRITEPGEFREEEYPEIPWYSIVSYLYYQYDGVDLCYGTYDFDGNGVPELVMLTRSEDYRQPIGIYAFDGSKFVYLCKELPLGDRTHVSVSGDGTFTVCGSGGASSGVVLVYRIAADGYNIDIRDWYTYEFQADGSVTITPQVGEMSAETFDSEALWRDFDVPIEYTVVS
ncbi:MAG: hypothetical protein IJ259_06775 [Oscillospiraceae bacterium]|nr:hypothetical protein [Oscillospiraceae bacterium]